MPDTGSGLYPADQWKPGNNYKAFDWDGYDEEDFPDQVKEQIAKDREQQSASVPKATTPAPPKKSAFSKIVKDRKIAPAKK